jgi:hypothetical protein
MGAIFAVLAVVGFWIVVCGTMLTLVRSSAREHDDEEMVCALGEDYFAQSRRLTA